MQLDVKTKFIFEKQSVQRSPIIRFSQKEIKFRLNVHAILSYEREMLKIFILTP